MRQFKIAKTRRVPDKAREVCRLLSEWAKVCPHGVIRYGGNEYTEFGFLIEVVVPMSAEIVRRAS